MTEELEKVLENEAGHYTTNDNWYFWAIDNDLGDMLCVHVLDNRSQMCGISAYGSLGLVSLKSWGILPQHSLFTPTNNRV